MIIPDANLLLYAHIPSFNQHLESKNWLLNFLAKENEILGLSLQVIMAFVRISTNQRLFENPLKTEEAVENIDLLLEHPLIEIVQPSKKYWSVFSKLLNDEKIIGDLIMDAHLVALAIENNAVIVSNDKDFLRFSKYVKTINPLKS
jgi:uncharacterized protein